MTLIIDQTTICSSWLPELFMHICLFIVSANCAITCTASIRHRIFDLMPERTCTFPHPPFLKLVLKARPTDLSPIRDPFMTSNAFESRRFTGSPFSYPFICLDVL